MRPDVREMVIGRWPGVLAALGFSGRELSGKHGSCPACGGTDRFRFDNKDGRGTWYCNNCGAGDGFKLVMLTRGVDFKGAAELVRDVLPRAPKAQIAKERSAKDKREAIEHLFKRTVAIESGDPVHRYLVGRGLRTIPPALRRARSEPYYVDGRIAGSYDAMVARMVALDGNAVGVHVTYLEDGQKAPVEAPRKQRTFATSAGAAVQLSAPALTLGIAEGIETALSASELFGLPVWAALNANGMESFLWPNSVRELVIFGDNDESFTGQEAAYTLARRAKSKGVAVRIEIPERPGEDWNDVLRARADEEVDL